LLTIGFKGIGGWKGGGSGGWKGARFTYSEEETSS
jgi:hypothetical protein